MSRLPLAVALSLLLLAPAPARAAQQLLDTITVPANSSSVVSGTHRLEAGTRYVIEVSGTMESTNTNGGYGHRYDALYCYGEMNVQSTSCADARKDPANRTLRAHDFKLSSGSLENDWRLADQFLTTSRPAGDQPAVDYDPNHSYTLGFHPPADGPIKAQTYYAATGGCPGCTNSTTGSFTVKVFGEPATPAASPGPSSTPGTQAPAACASAAQVVGPGSGCDEATCIACRKFGTTSILPAPKPNRPVEVGGVTISPEAREVLFEAGIEDAASQQLIATLIVQARQRRLRDSFWGCLYIGTQAPDPYQSWNDSGPRNPQKLSAMIAACSRLIAEEAEKEAAAARPVAVASQAGCKMLFFPVYSRKEQRSAKRRKQIRSAVRQAFEGSCAASSSRLGFRLKSKRAGVPLYRLTNRKPSARLVRVAKKGTPTPRGAKLYVRWRKP